MDQLPLAEYGVALGAIVAIVFIIRQFLAHLKDKDDKFTGIVTNHMTHATEAQVKLSTSIDRNTDATNKLVDKVDQKL